MGKKSKPYTASPQQKKQPGKDAHLASHDLPDDDHDQSARALRSRARKSLASAAETLPLLPRPHRSSSKQGKSSPPESLVPVEHTADRRARAGRASVAQDMSRVFSLEADTADHNSPAAVRELLDPASLGALRRNRCGRAVALIGVALCLTVCVVLGMQSIAAMVWPVSDSHHQPPLNLRDLPHPAFAASLRQVLEPAVAHRLNQVQFGDAAPPLVVSVVGPAPAVRALVSDLAPWLARALGHRATPLFLELDAPALASAATLRRALPDHQPQIVWLAPALGSLPLSTFANPIHDWCDISSTTAARSVLFLSVAPGHELERSAAGQFITPQAWRDQRPTVLGTEGSDAATDRRLADMMPALLNRIFSIVIRSAPVSASV